MAGQEWSGLTPPLSGKTVTFAVTQEDKWKRLWKRLSDDGVPMVRFADHMVLAVIAGSAEPCDRVQIEDMRAESSDLHVRYRQIVRPDLFSGRKARAGAAKKVPYHLVVIPRTVLKAKFEQIEE